MYHISISFLPLIQWILRNLKHIEVINKKFQIFTPIKGKEVENGKIWYFDIIELLQTRHLHIQMRDSGKY